MLQVVRCLQCSRVGWDMALTTVTLAFATHEHCHSCHKSHSREQRYTFCSAACMVEWVKDNEQAIREARP